MITRNFKLCLNAGTALAPYINVNQYDHGEQWVFTLYNEDGTIYTPSTGAIIGIKADGRAIANAGSVVDGKVVINETEQMTAAAGRAIYELLIDDDTHGTANFVVNVERRPADNADLSESDISLLQEAIDAAEVINEVIGEGGDPSELITENVNNWLDTHPEATTTVLDGAITAPKINNSLWDKLLVSESASGAVASFDDGADDVPVSSLKVALEPIQLGSGDPSPSNIRPIYPANGKNLLQVTATSQTINGVTFTVNSDGTILANGTASENISFFIANPTFIADNPSGTYFLSGCPSGGSTSTYRMSVTGATGSDIGIGVSVAYSGTITDTRLRIVIVNGTVCNNLVFTPMIRLASITAPSYQPYQGIMVERNGKNVLPVTVQGIISANNWGWSNNTATRNNCVWTILTDDGTNVTGIEVNGTANANTYLYILPTTQNMRYLPTGSYIISGGVANTAVIRAWHYDGSNTAYSTGNDVSFTLTETGRTGGVVDITVNNGTVLNHAVFKPMIRYASVADATFEPYQSTSYPYTLGQTVYGGTVDLATGVLTVTHGFATLDGSETWVIATTDPNAYFFTNASADFLNANARKAMYCDKLQAGDPSSPIGSFSDNTIWYIYRQIHIKASTAIAPSGLTNAGISELKEWLSSNNVSVVLPLANPITVQLTPTEVKTLLGYNNISSTGTVDVIYHADTKLYVDKMTAVDNAIIAPTEDGFTATRNYTVNDLVIVNDTLYKVTANIANGGTITPNSNVTATTLSALIKALS